LSATLVQLLLILVQQVGGALFMIWFFRWRQDKERLQKVSEQIPSDLVERFQDLEKLVNSFRERMARIEAKTNGVAWKPGGLAHRGE